MYTNGSRHYSPCLLPLVLLLLNIFEVKSQRGKKIRDQIMERDETNVYRLTVGTVLTDLRHVTVNVIEQYNVEKV